MGRRSQVRGQRLVAGRASWARRLARVTALVLVFSVLLVTWTPDSASAAPLKLPEVSLTGLLDWLTGHGSPTPLVPAQETGTAAGLPHQVPASATRAGRGKGGPPGTAPGQLPPYHPFVPPSRTFGGGQGTTGTAGGEAAQGGARARGATSYNPAASTLVASGMTASANLYRNADGTYSRKVYSNPVNYLTPAGTYAPIDTSLVPGAGGRWQEKANSVGVSLSGQGDDADLGSLGLSGGQSFSFSLAGATAVPGVAKGSQVAYRSVLPGTDLVESATFGGIKEQLILRSASARSTWVFPLRLRGLTAVLAADGSVNLLDAAGKVAAVIPHGFAADSRYNPHTGNPARTGAVTYQVIAYQGGQALQVTLDQAWLSDPARVFPVTVDPSGSEGATGSTYVLYPFNNDYSANALMQTGTYDGGGHYARTFYHFDYVPADLPNTHLTYSALYVMDSWAYSCGTTTFNVDPITSSWSTTGLKTWPGPSVGASIGSWTGAATVACPSATHTTADPNTGQWLALYVQPSAINSWTLNPSSDNGLAVDASTTDSNQYKQFDGFNSPYPPYLLLTYTPNVPPQVNTLYPQNDYNSRSLTPLLQAWAVDPDNWPSPLTYQFTVKDAVTNAVAAQSAWQSSPGWTVPAGMLAWNKIYYWYVEVYDGLDYNYSGETNVLSTPVPQPGPTAALSQNPGNRGFDPSNGNYTTSVTDAKISAAGPSLAVERSYNSADYRKYGAFGAGWSSLFDARVDPGISDSPGAPRTVWVTYPDGQQIGFGANAGSSIFTPPPGRFATLKAVTGGYTLTDKNDTVYSFTQSLGGGSYGISSVTDAIGNSLNLTYNASGQITAVTSAVSGRALHLTWGTPAGAGSAHVTAVATDPVTPGNPATALTWGYSYSGDELASVCPPGTTTACTGYAYTTATRYVSQTVGTGAHSLWPLTETSGTTAVSATVYNEGADNATYANVTLGQPGGPLTGSAGTVAGFNGTSSYLKLPSDLVGAAQDQSISVWFKTTATGQVLFAASQDAVTAGTTPGNYVPELYVGTSGHLYGEFWDGSVSPVKSAVTVNDGKWHQAVLVATDTNTEQLYLDGSLSASASGIVWVTGQSYGYVGGGFIGGAWPDEPHSSTTSDTGYASYFNGSIADAGFWSRPLTPAEVGGLYTSATTSAIMMTRITRPSGNVYSKAGYDAVTGALAQVTDANGGTWALHPATDSGSSQAYASAVLADGPADYWRFADSVTTQPVNEVNGGAATNSVNGTGALTLTEGVAGPFAPGDPADTAYSFSAANSASVTLPSGLVTGAGNQSVGLWFNTTATGQVLFSTQDTALGSATTTGYYTPELYIGSSGHLTGEFWDNTFSPMSTTTAVNDGKWHYVVLAAGATGQSLYLDGALVASKSVAVSGSTLSYTYVAGGYIGGPWPDEPHYSTTSNTGYASYFTGSIGEVAFYNSQLSAAQVSAGYAAARDTTGVTPTQTATVTDPGGKTLSYVTDPVMGNRLIAQTDGLGHTTKFSYDTAGFLSKVTDPNGNATTTGYDVRGNLVSENTCQNRATTSCSTAYYTYFPDDTSAQLTNPDARDDLPLTARAAGSASATDNTYLTSYSYNATGELTAETTPAVSGFPQGRTSTASYTTATTPAIGGGTTAPGLPATVTTPGGAVTTTQYYSDGDVAQVTDPDGLVTSFTYDGIGRLLSKKVVSNSYPAGLTTTYSYDSQGRLVTETDPRVVNRVTGATHTALIASTYDADGNLLTQTAADSTGGDASRAVNDTYNANDQLASSADPAGAVTRYTYDTYGNRITTTDAAGNVSGYTYDPNGNPLTVTLANFTGNPSNPRAPATLTESSRAYDPGGRLASITNSMGFTTSYTYADNNLVATITRSDPVKGTTFTAQSNTYNLANQLITQVTNNGVTTTNYTPDAAGRDYGVTVDPTGLNRTTSYAFSPDNQVITQAVSSPGTSPAQVTDYTYDARGNMTSRSVHNDNAAQAPAGWWPLNDATAGQAGAGYAPTFAADASGKGDTGILSGSGVTWGAGYASFSGATGEGITTGWPAVNTASSFSVSAWADMTTATSFGTVVSEHSTAQDGMRLQYDPYTGAWSFNRATADSTSGFSMVAAESAGAAQTGVWTHLVGTFDATTGTMTLYVNGVQSGSTATDATPFAASGPLAIGNAQYSGAVGNWFAGDIANVAVFPSALSPAQVSSLYAAGQNGTPDGDSRLTTTWALDQRGLPTSMTDPNGNLTQYGYDEAGRLAVTTAPTVPTQVYGGTVVQAHPVTMTGYNTFGEKAEVSDANGNVTTTVYDAAGRPVSVTAPPYTPPGAAGPITAVATTGYNGLGEVTSQTDPRNNTTSYTYDQVGDVASVTTPDTGVTSYTYDTNGDQLSVTGPTGAVTSATYDFMGRKITSTQVERYPSAASFTTSYSYAPGGWLASQTTPDGVATSATYNPAGEVATSTDGAGNLTGYGYDPAGRQISVTNPDLTVRTRSYDEAGRMTGQADLSSAGAVLRSASAAYDNAGNPLSATDYRGNPTTYSYDATGLMSGEVQPVSATSSITTSFGYDAAGNQTRYTDGNGNNWWTTYNPWNQPQSKIEPATTAFPAAADGTFTTSYDASGNPVSQSQPGGVTLSASYDSMGRVTGQSGTGADAATASRAFAYDLAGNLTSASTPAAGSQAATSETFAYNDRGLLVSASGTAGSSSLSYNGDGQPVSVTDAAGTTSFGYDTGGRLSALADPLTGTTATVSYNQMSQLAQISYGAGNDVREFGYNSLHQLTSDALTTSAGAAVASVSYGYDPNGNLTSKTTAGFAGSSANTYTYDYANRLTSWNNGTAATGYAYDGAGNLTQSGAKTFTYDARDQLTSDGTSAYSYTARGTLALVAGPSGTQAYTSDAYGQAVTQAGGSYAYDGVGRLVSAAGPSGTRALSYSGSGQTLASDGVWKYSWDPSGTTLAGAGPAGGTTAQGTIAFTDAHTDVTGSFAPAGTALSGSASYDPWGSVTAASGLAGNLGYQSGWTDPVTARVHMGARWYAPGLSRFTSRDTVAVNPVPSSGQANPFAYVGDDPLGLTDPSGHCAWYDVVCGVVKVAKAVVRVVVNAAKTVVAVVKNVGHAIVAGLTTVYDAAASGARVLAKVVTTAASSTYQWGVTHYHAAVKRISTAWNTVKRVASATGSWVMHHAPAIASFVVSTAVFMGCDAALGIATEGVGAVLGAAECGSLAGAAGNAVSYGITAMQTGKFSLSGLASSVISGAFTGALSGAAGSVVGKGVSSLVGKGASLLLGRGADAAAADAATTAAASGADATANAAARDTAAGVARDTAGTAERGGVTSDTGAGGSCGLSFAASTPVLTASGRAVAISRLRKGDKVIATDTRTGKTGPAAVSAVLVNHDTNLFDLKVRSGGRTSVIGTTSNHPFWDLTQHKWVKAGALKYGDRLRAPSGAAVTAAGGSAPRRHDGWMWDLTVPGPHDFYIRAATTAILVHNCGNARFAVDSNGVATDLAPEAQVDLYHGTSSSGAESIMKNGVDPSYAPRPRDFGNGFYTTRDLGQAAQWAARKFGSNGTVLHFSVPASALDSLSSLSFEGDSAALQAFLRLGRSGGSHGYEMVEGPMLMNPGGFMKGADPVLGGNQVAFFGDRAASILDESLVGTIP